MTFDLSPSLVDSLMESFSDSINEFKIRDIHADQDDDEVCVIARISIISPAAKSQTWELRLKYSEEEASAAGPDAEQVSLDWFKFMLTEHIIEWWATKERVPEFKKLGRRLA